MALVSPPVCDFDWPAPGFRLPATDGRVLSLEDVRGPNGTLVMFICNHCPYVLNALDRILSDAHALLAEGVGVVAISSNDAETYPQDSFPRMQEMAEMRGFPFPYLYDESQNVARAYDAQCTPDFFGFNAEMGLQYRGRLDDVRGVGPADGARRELLEAMRQVAETGRGPQEQVPSMGCSIKWRA